MSAHWWNEQAQTLDAAKRAVWSEDDTDWDGRVADCLAAIVPHLRLRPGDSVLDLGCGIGRLAGPLVTMGAEQNWHVVGVDVSERMLDLARRLDSRPLFVHVDDLPMFEAFDAAYSMLVFQHVEPDEVRRLLSLTFDSLRPGCFFRFQFVAGEQHAEHDHHYRPDEMIDWLDEAGFRFVNFDDGLLYPEWTWITAQR